MGASDIVVTIIPWFLAFGGIVVGYFQYIERVKIETKPNIAIFHTIGSQNISDIELHIKNYGPGIARKVEFSFINGGDFKTPSGDEIQELDLMKNGIDTLGRDEEKKFVLTNLKTNYVETKMDINITVSVTYKSERGMRYTPDPFKIRLKEFHGLRYFPIICATPEDYTAATPNTDIGYYSDASGNIVPK